MPGFPPEESRWDPEAAEGPVGVPYTASQDRHLSCDSPFSANSSSQCPCPNRTESCTCDGSLLREFWDNLRDSDVTYIDITGLFSWDEVLGGVQEISGIVSDVAGVVAIVALATGVGAPIIAIAGGIAIAAGAVHAGTIAIQAYNTCNSGKGSCGDAVGEALLSAAAIAPGGRLIKGAAAGAKALSNASKATKIPATGNDLLKPGPWAKESVKSSSPGKITKAEREQLNPIGDKYGCHSCGSTTPGTKYGDWVGDHQPPTYLTLKGDPQVLYPQCRSCSDAQGMWMLDQIRKGLI